MTDPSDNQVEIDLELSEYYIQTGERAEDRYLICRFPCPACGSYILDFIDVHKQVELVCVECFTTVVRRGESDLNNENFVVVMTYDNQPEQRIYYKPGQAWYEAVKAR